MTPGFERAFAFVLEREGGYANDPLDRGGATMRGVTQAVYDRWRDRMHLPRQPVRRISDAEVRKVYWFYWDDADCEVVDALGKPDLALVHLDCAINCGAGMARRLLQRALGLVDDGIIGVRTRAAIRACDEAVTELAYLEVRARYYQAIVTARPSQAKWLNGWMARLRHAARAVGAHITTVFARSPENGAPPADV